MSNKNKAQLSKEQLNFACSVLGESTCRDLLKDPADTFWLKGFVEDAMKMASIEKDNQIAAAFFGSKHRRTDNNPIGLTAQWHGAFKRQFSAVLYEKNKRPAALSEAVYQSYFKPRNEGE